VQEIGQGREPLGGAEELRLGGSAVGRAESAARLPKRGALPQNVLEALPGVATWTCRVLGRHGPGVVFPDEAVSQQYLDQAALKLARSSEALVETRNLG
jgi:phage tail protein X